MKRLSIKALPISLFGRSLLKWREAGIFLLIAIATYGFLFLVDTVFRIRYVIIESRENAKQIRLGGIAGRRTLVVTHDELVDSIRRANPLIKSVEVRLSYPDKVYLTPQWYRQVAYIECKDGMLVVSAEGVIVRKLPPGEVKDALPSISYYQQFPFSEYQAGDQLPAKDIQDALAFYVFLKRRGYEIQRIDIRGFHMLGLYSQTQEFIFSSLKERSQQEYQFLQSRIVLKQRGKQFKSIDLRFDKPVVVLL